MPSFTKLFAIPVLISFVSVYILGDTSLLFAAGSSASPGNPESAQLGQMAQAASAVQSFQADLFTGRAQTSVPIFVPPGRKKINPNLALSYSSSGGSGWLGAGWGLDMGYIQRDVKRGVPKYDSTDKYVFSYQGVSSELTLVATNEYRAKHEALFLKIVYDPTGNSWTVTDKSGTKHLFGGTTDSRQTNASGTFKWCLSKVIDTSSNYMSITYSSDGGELYLSQIDYNGNEAQSFAHTHRVLFTLETRNDKSFSYLSGAKVELNKRLKEIEVKVKDGSGVYQLARKYALSYAYSAATARSRLTSIVECGKDGTTNLPAVTFTYQNKPLEFESLADFGGVARATSSTMYDFIRHYSTSAETIVDFLDMNGDGKNDRVQALGANTSWKVQYNQGSSFGALADFGTLHKPSSWSGYDYISRMTDAREQATDMIDITGDGLPDRVIATDANTSWIVQVNNGSGFNGTNASWGGIQRMVSSSGRYDYIRYTPLNGTSGTKTLVDFFDITGDGLPDRVMAEEGVSSWKVQVNTGSGFNSMQNWGTLQQMAANNVRDAIRVVSDSGEVSVDVADLNGDGLIDRVQANDSNTYWKVQFNTGSGFTTMQDWGPIERMTNIGRRDFIRHNTDSGEQTTDLFDINGDGLPDRVQATDNNTNWKVQYNTGTGFTSMQDFGTIGYMVSNVRWSYSRWTNTSGQMAVDMADLDNDGLPDRIQANDNNTAWKIQKNKGPFPDLLSVIENGRGGKTTITYSASPAFDNTDTNGKHRLPFPIQVVSQVKQEDGMGNQVITDYSYKGGMFDAEDREFRGFREVTVTDAAGTKSIHTFGQTDHNKGKLLQKEVRDSSNNLFAKEVTTWSDTHPWGETVDVHFTYVSQQDNYIYDGDSSYKQTRQTFTYDAYGNLASTTEEGDVSLSGDSRKTVNAYAYGMTAPGSGSGNYIVNTLKKTTLYDTDLTTVKAEKYFFYDSAASIDTAPVKGLLTKEEEWLSTACGTPGAGCTGSPKTSMTYDSYGNIATVTDARGYVTANTYETTYKLFLTQISNALSQTRQFTYDPWIAQILTSTDQNGQVTTTVYDPLGRVVKVISPLDSSSEPTQEFTYEYPNLGTCLTSGAGGTPLCTSKTTVKIKASVPGQTYTYLTVYSFTDGIGREIQKRAPAEDPAKQIVTGGVSFNSRGLVDKQWTPYFENAGTGYAVPPPGNPKANFTYDAIGRRTRTDYPDGTNSQITFNDFVKTTTDPRGKQLRYTNDAYGRLNRVEEINSGSTYTTTYEYDVLNNLKKTTDNANNQTTITYDSLSRKTGMADPDMGAWSYAYDKNDNLTSQTDAKNQTISFTYDALNRVTLKNLPGSETDVQYNYDTAPSGFSGQTGYWVGRLAKVTDASGTHEFKYDKLGRVTDDKKVAGGLGYTFTRTYDSMGRVRTITYPDAEVVTYTYNNFGDVETIQGVKSSVTYDYVKDVNYNASGQITFLKYGNNVTSDYTYNSNTLRLSNILTKKPDGTTKLQDLSYTFDNNGNVTQISDVVNSMSQTFTYDDLNRLLTAVGSAYGTQSFTYDSIGNMTNKAGRTMSYPTNGVRPHAVSSVTGSSLPTYCAENQGACNFAYDANGNMTQRASDTLAYDSENRLKEVRAYAGETATQNYTLAQGWNIISFPRLPENKAVTNVLSSLVFNTDYDQISYYDPAASSWKHYVNDSDFNDFTSFEYGRSYAIYVTKAGGVSFSVSGKSSAVDITSQVKVGENFIGPAVKSATNVTTVLSGLTYGTHYSDIKRYNASTQAFELYSAGAFTQFEPGKGYVLVGLQNSSFSYGKTETVTTFVYDSTGSRVEKTTGSTTTYYLGKDYDVTGSVSNKYIFLGDRRIVIKDNSNVSYFIHDDHISSSNVVTNSSGNQAALYEYDPYGSTATHTGSVDLKHRFTGQEADDSTNLYYYGARYYDPQIGRFISADWIVPSGADPQSLNRYSYARNNPIIFTDPTGNFPFVAAIIGAIIGAIASGAQSDWNPKAMLIGAGIGFLSGGYGGYVGAAGGGAIIGGAVSGAVAGGLNAAVYGGDIGQGILRGAGFGALGGAVFGGIDVGFDKIASQPGFRWEYVRAAEILASGAAGGGISQLSGGEFWEGVAFSSAIAGSRFLYEVSTSLKEISGRDLLKTSSGEWSPKEAAQSTHDFNSGKSNFGRRILKGEKPDWFKSHVDGENSRLMRAAGQYIPGAEGSSFLHDKWQGAIGSRSALVSNVTNFPTMVPAAAVTYFAAANDPSMMATFELYDKDAYK